MAGWTGRRRLYYKALAIEELLARIGAALRKSAPPPENGVLTAQNVCLDSKRRTVTVSGQTVELTKREFDLLHYLLKNKGIVVTREMLMENVWEFDFDGGTNAVDVYIRFLRGKIDRRLASS